MSGKATKGVVSTSTNLFIMCKVSYLICVSLKIRIYVRRAEKT
jgi:hypothetical protein